jgi:ribbon-helix-helix CopG family protein
MNHTHITLRLPDDLAKSLSRRARARNVPKSQIVREAVANYLIGAPLRPEPRMVTALELAARWPAVPHLTPAEAASMAADIEGGRIALPLPAVPWE